MPQYNKGNINELHKILYNSDVHDAKIENIQYSCEDDSIIVLLHNSIFDVDISFKFFNVGLALTIKGEWPGNRDTILSLTAENDASCLQSFLIKHDIRVEESLYMMFQMLSGGELHIISKEVNIEINRHTVSKTIVT